MNRPEGIKPEYLKAGEALYDKIGFGATRDAETLARAIQSSVETERAKALKFASAAMIREGKEDWAKGYRCAAADILDAIKGA